MTEIGITGTFDAIRQSFDDLPEYNPSGVTTSNRRSFHVMPLSPLSLFVDVASSIIDGRRLGYLHLPVLPVQSCTTN